MSIDKDSNNVSLFNIIEEIHIGVAPPDQQSDENVEGPTALIPTPFQLLIQCARTEPEEGEKGLVRFKVVPPIGKALTTNEIIVDLTEFRRVRVRTMLPGFPAAGTGIYLILIQSKEDGSDWKDAFEAPIQVWQDSPPAEDPAQASPG